MKASQMNPFTPNFGQVPMHLAGRDFLIQDVTTALRQGSGHPAQTSLFIGARGTGKTALLSYLADQAQGMGWVSVNCNCTSNLLEDVMVQAYRASAHLADMSQKRQIKGVTLGSVVLTWEDGVSVPSNWRSNIEDLLDCLSTTDTGLLITIDEVDPQNEAIVQLVSDYQLLLRDGRKVALLMAGLPSKVDALVSHNQVSFLRRATQMRIGAISDMDVRATLRQTLIDAGKTISEEALDVAVKAIDGFAYMIQLVGYRIWQRADSQVEITAALAKSGVIDAGRDFKERVLQTTLNELSDMDITFLKAMIDCKKAGETLTLDNIAKKLGNSKSYATTYKNRLMQSGIIERKGRNALKISLPMVEEFLPEYLGEE